MLRRMTLVRFLLLCALLAPTLSCRKRRPPLDVEALGESATMLIASYQGPKSVRVTFGDEPVAWRDQDGDSLEEALGSLGTDNEVGVALVDQTYVVAQKRLASLLHLLDSQGDPLLEVDEQLPSGGTHSIYKLSHHAAEPTLLMMRGGDTPQRLASVAKQTGADLTAWISVACSIRATQAEATFSVIMADVYGRRVAWGDGVGQVDAIETLQLTPGMTTVAGRDAALAICKPGVDRAMERIAATFLGVE